MEKQVLKTSIAVVIKKVPEYKNLYLLLGDPKKASFNAFGTEENIHAGDTVEYEIYKEAYFYRTNRKGEKKPQWSSPIGPVITRNISVEERIKNYKETYKAKLAQFQQSQLKAKNR